MAHVKKMDEVVSLHYNLLSAEDWDKKLRSRYGFELIINEVYSRNQALLYDMASMGRRVPDFYFHHMAYREFNRFSFMKCIVGWAVGVVAARFARMKMEPGQGTLFTI